MVKKIFKIIAIIFVLFLGAAFAAPYLFKDKILVFVKQELNKKLNATVDFKDINLSLFKSFPKLSVGVNNLTIVGKNEFVTDTLLAAKNMSIAVDFMSAVKQKDIKIYNISVKNPTVKVHILKNGKPNWDIVIPTNTVQKDTAAPLQLSLNSYEIEDANIYFVDDANNTSATILNLQHSGQGDFTNQQFILQTNTLAESIDVVYGGISYLNNIKAKVDAKLDVNNVTNTYTFDTKDIFLNDLQLNAKGNIKKLPAEAYGIDISFNTLSSSFKTLLSFIPSIYKNNFSTIQTQGTARFNGFVKGVYNETSLPGYSINIAAKDGYFKYPNLPTSVENIQLDAHVNNTSGMPDDVVIDVTKAHFEIEKDPFDFTLQVKNPISNLWVNAAAVGKLNLQKTTNYLPIEKTTVLSGLVNANATINGFAKAIVAKQFTNLNAKGTIDIKNFNYKSKDYPTGVNISNVNVILTPQQFTLNNIDAQLQKSNFKGSGFVSNFIPYAFSNGILNGVLNVTADNIYVNNWMGKKDTANTSAKEPLQAFIVPKNVNITINSAANYIEYDKLKITNASGVLQINDETVKVTNLKGNSMNGLLTANGVYTTKENKQQPAINFNYAVNNVDIQQAFVALNTIEKLLPIGKFINGKLNSSFNMSGILGSDLMPQLTTLSGIGNLLMLDGVLNSFAPLEKIASTLKVNELKNISAKDIKAFIEFSNGKVLVKPFKVKVKGIDMEIGGLHGLNQDMDYTINMNIPREMISDKGNSIVNELQNKAKNVGANIVIANLIPVQIKMGGSMKNPTISTNLKATGSNLANDLKNQVQSFVQTKVDAVKAQADSAKKALADTVKATKQLIIKNAKNELIKQVLGNKDTTQKTGNVIDDTKKQLEQKGKGLLEKFNPFKRKQQEVKDTVSH